MINFFVKLKYLFLFLVFFNLSVNMLGAVSYNIIPFPQTLIPHYGNFRFDKNTVLLVSANDVEVKKVAGQFAAQLQLVSGIVLQKNASKSLEMDLRFGLD